MSVLSANEIKCTRRYEACVVAISQSAILSGNAMSDIKNTTFEKGREVKGEIDEYEC